MGVGQARAKLLLFGEHAAVYGYPAVGVALPWAVTVTRSRTANWEFPGLGPYESAVRAVVEKLTALAVQEQLPPPLAGQLRFETNVPVAAGFGSSGALCACLVNLFFGDLALPERERLAWEAEKLFHGTPSGIDTALALRQGWWVLDTASRPAAASPLPDPGLTLVVGAVVRDSDTKALIADLATKRQQGQALELDRLGNLAAEAVQVLKGGQAVHLGGLVGEARRELRSLGLESPAMTRILDGAQSLTGAVGKLSGAGGGGAFFLIYPDAETAREALPVVSALAEPSSWVLRPALLPSPIS